MEKELTQGPVMKTMLLFAIPMILGDLLQQCYNIADTLIVGKFLGVEALAAVGSAFSLMTFVTSILLGLAMGSGTVFSIRFGQGDKDGLKEAVLASFTLLAVITVILNLLIFLGLDWIILFLRTPESLKGLMKEYLSVIFAGMAAIFLYNFFSSLTCLQQSVMNFGILTVQGLVNSFGTTVMAAFAAAVKIDAFAYLPVQDFGNAFSIFTAQNFGAKKQDRIRKGIRVAVLTSFSFSLLVSALVFSFAAPLMSLFLDAKETAVIAEGVRYLRIEGAFYCLIGGLFLLYGLYRALEQPGMSVVLTVVSLGTRVGLAYLLSAIPAVGVVGIWWAVPIGWFLADALGVGYYLLRPAKALSQQEYRS